MTSNLKLTMPTRPKIVLDQDFMPFIVICKFEDTLIKNEGDRSDNIEILSTYRIDVTESFRLTLKLEILVDLPQT